MLVTRPYDSEHTWSSKYETAYHKPTSPRMSNFEGPLPAQPEWQGHYSFLPPGENNLFAQPFEQTSGSANGNDASANRRTAASHSSATEDSNHQGHGDADVVSPMSQSRTLAPLNLPTSQTGSPAAASDARRESFGVKTEATNEESLASTDSTAASHTTNPLSTTSSTGHSQDTAPSHSGNEEAAADKQDEDESMEDEDMLSGEGEESRPQTAAERTAARRKMKRFRLTHQQTRFLMSEFAKQPHPDAAHRERLSREIPGLSPRQVQVWFQNRRAKIKRLTADDRDRMIKMRAVPDDFDNVQALHSPYGAVHALGTPMSSPVDYRNPSYAHHMMRPLMVDTIRAEGDNNHMPSPGLSPAFGGMGYAPHGGVNSPGLMAPMSPAASDPGRSYYSSAMSNPMDNGPRTSNPFGDRSLDSGMSMHSRQPIRPLQPLQLRETMSRSRNDNLQSPLRSSMSWKGSAIDYNYQGQTSPAPSGREQSVYQPEPMTSTPSSGMSYESGYPTSGVQSPQSNITYPSMSSGGFQQSPEDRSSSRLRATSGTVPLGLDLRHQQYRQPTSGQTSTPRAASTTPYGTSNAYTSSYPSAPLTAPVDFSLPRTPGVRQDFSMPQLSAPIAPSQDFSQAMQGGSMGSQPSRTPLSDSFNNNGMPTSQSQGANERRDDYFQTRKRSFSSTPGAGPALQAYGQHAS